MSHLACADDPDHPKSELQRHSFDIARVKLPHARRASPIQPVFFWGRIFTTISCGRASRFMAARRARRGENPLRQWLSSRRRILQVRDVPAGETVGYGATRTRRRAPSSIAVLSVGYADGLFRSLSVGDGKSGLIVYVGAHPAPILGRVSMDLITIDVTDVPAAAARRGALVELIGDRTLPTTSHPRRHHRLRGAHHSRRARLAALCRRLSDAWPKPPKPCLPGLRRGDRALVRQMRLMRRMELHRRGDGPLRLTRRWSPSKAARGGPRRFERLAAETHDAPRFPTGIAEFDRVLGGGLVPGSAVLVGGDPGIGKSTLLLQAAAELAASGAPVVYLSGEEAPAQVRMRAARLGLAQAPVALGTETNLANIVATLGKATPPALVVIDSVQTLWSESAGGRARHHLAAQRLRLGACQLCQDQRLDASCWSAMSPRTGRSPGPR